MDLLLISIYAAICVLIFKLFKIPLNKWSVPTAALGGVIILGTLIILMNYNHPYSDRARKYALSTPIVPAVSGMVQEVNVQTNVHLEKGAVLFKLDPIPYQGAVDALTAQLISAKADLQRAKQLLKTGSGSRRNRDLAQAQYDDIKSQLSVAQFNLKKTVVRAPASGYVTQVILRPGMMTANLPLRPVMTFVPDGHNIFVGWFRQNSLLRLTPGDEAEIVFDGIPGEVFKGKVDTIFPLLAEGQLQPSGTLLNDSAPPGRIPVRIVIDDPKFKQYRTQVPGGAYGQMALYTDHFHHVAIMRKILLRMSAWLNYVFPIH